MQRLENAVSVILMLCAMCFFVTGTYWFLNFNYSGSDAQSGISIDKNYILNLKGDCE